MCVCVFACACVRARLLQLPKPFAHCIRSKVFQALSPARARVPSLAAAALRLLLARSRHGHVASELLNSYNLEIPKRPSKRNHKGKGKGLGGKEGFEESAVPTSAPNFPCRHLEPGKQVSLHVRQVGISFAVLPVPASQLKNDHKRLSCR